MLEHVAATILSFSAAASGSLANAVVQGLCLSAAVALCVRLLPGIKPAARFAIWLSVLLTVLALHFESVLSENQGHSFVSGVPAFHFDPRWAVPIAAAWVTLSLARAIALARSAFELHRIAKAAKPVSLDEPLRSLLTTRLRSAQLCTSAHVDRPSVVGFLHPRVLLPADLLQKLSLQELEQILLHEMEHLRRFDDWTNLLQKTVLVFFPLNPVLLWIERRLCRERELACDDCVLRFTAARKTYASCLTNLAEHSLVRRGVTLALGAWEKQSELSRRVYRILSKPETHMKPATANLVTGIMMAGLVGGAVTLARTPELVSFAPTAVSTPTPRTIPATAEASPATIAKSTFSAQLVKAVVPDKHEKSVTHRSAQAPHRQIVKDVHRAPDPKLQQWIVLTHWSPTTVRQHAVFTLSEGSDSSYAAVPVGNGWLIIQL